MQFEQLDGSTRAKQTPTVQENTGLEQVGEWVYDAYNINGEHWGMIWTIAGSTSHYLASHRYWASGEFTYTAGEGPMSYYEAREWVEKKVAEELQKSQPCEAKSHEGAAEQAKTPVTVRRYLEIDSTFECHGMEVAIFEERDVPALNKIGDPPAPKNPETWAWGFTNSEHTTGEIENIYLGFKTKEAAEQDAWEYRESMFEDHVEDYL